MAMRDDFNSQAMEEKIAKNIERGFTHKTILSELMTEQKKCFESMRMFEARAVELQDQIDYMREHHVKPDNIHS